MKPSIVATLICICCHTAASHACETTPTPAKMPSNLPSALSANLSTHMASPPAARLVAAAATGVDSSPVVRRTAAHTHTDGAPPAYTPAVARPMPVAVAAPSTTGQPAPAAEGSSDRSETMLAVALALMAGIALRRWGSARP